MFHIKICGVRQLDDVRAVAASGADAIGLNFFPPSVRYVDPGDAATRELADLARELELKVVGVFVNEAPERISQIVEQIGLDAVQLHGDEEPSVVAEIGSRSRTPIVRAIKLPVEDLRVTMIQARTEPWLEMGIHLLLDADAGRAHGGSGKQLNWDVIREWATSTKASAWTLAGGLNPGNVHEAIKVSGAISVDTASGVEQPKGVKSAAKIRRFVEQCSR